MNKVVLQLNEIISQLLWKEECVIVPKLGAFISREHKTAINPVTHTFKPDSKTIFFNPNIEQTDGMLAHFITENFGLSYADANDYIAKEVEEIKSKVNQGERIEWDNLGSFFGSNDKLFFIPAATANFNKASYGLPSLQLKPVEQKTKETKTVERAKPIITEAKKEEVISEERDYSKTALTPEIDQPKAIEPQRVIGKKKVFLWAAAAVLAVALTIIGFNNENKTYTTNKATALSFDPTESGTVENMEVNSDVEEDNSFNQEYDFTAEETGTEEQDLKTNEEFTDNIPEEYNVATEEMVPATEENYTTEEVSIASSWKMDDQFHIIIYHTLVSDHAESFLNQTDGNILFIENSLIYRVSMVSSNNLAELETTLWEMQNTYPNAYILDKSKYKNL